MSMCPSAASGESPEVLVLRPLLFQCLEGMGLHPTYGNTVPLMIGMLSGIGQKAPGCESVPYICLLLSNCDMCPHSLSGAVCPQMGNHLLKSENFCHMVAAFPRKGLPWILKLSLWVIPLQEAGPRGRQSKS